MNKIKEFVMTHLISDDAGTTCGLYCFVVMTIWVIYEIL